MKKLQTTFVLGSALGLMAYAADTTPAKPAPAAEKTNTCPMQSGMTMPGMNMKGMTCPMMTSQTTTCPMKQTPGPTK